MKNCHHDELLLEQCGVEFLVRIRGPYHNEDRTHLFIEVMGEVTRNGREARSVVECDRQRMEMDGYLFRGLNNFNWELYQLALQRRQQFLRAVEESP